MTYPVSNGKMGSCCHSRLYAHACAHTCTHTHKQVIGKTKKVKGRETKARLGGLANCQDKLTVLRIAYQLSSIPSYSGSLADSHSPLTTILNGKGSPQNVLRMAFAHLLMPHLWSQGEESSFLSRGKAEGVHGAETSGNLFSS